MARMTAPPTPDEHAPMSRREERMARRIALWEARRAGPPPPRYWHRAIITILMMAMMVFLLWLLVTSPGSSAGI